MNAEPSAAGDPEIAAAARRVRRGALAIVLLLALAAFVRWLGAPPSPAPAPGVAPAAARP